MKLHTTKADILIPDGLELNAGLSRTTHLTISAHQDDIEIMAFHGVLQCYGLADKWFTGVVCTNGAGSPRTGVYGKFTDEEMQKIRHEEQRNAARLGKYAAMLQLGYTSKEVKDAANPNFKNDLVEILKATRPDVVYTHNPADKHPTHVGVMVATVRAIRELPKDQRPQKLYGCEVWRGLDWMPDAKKVVMDVGGHDSLAATLLGAFDSQIAGGKRYDLATMGRRCANATYLESHATDDFQSATYVMDLTPVIQNDNLNLIDFVSDLINEFRGQVEEQLKQLL